MFRGYAPRTSTLRTKGGDIGLEEMRAEIKKLSLRPVPGCQPHNLATMPDLMQKVCKTATNDTRISIATGGVHGVYFTRDIVDSRLGLVPPLLAVGPGGQALV